jgi:hypothetical protein
MRLLLPADVVITGVTLDGVPINPRTDTTKPPVIPYVERTDTASSFYTLGIGLDVPAESTRHLSVTYTRADIVHFGADGAVVDLFLQKQPGVSGSPVHTIVQYPASWIAGMEGQGDFIAHVGEIEYNTVLDRDTLTRIRFTK